MPQTYEQVVEESRRAFAQARLSDPEDHFPYKHDVVVALIEENPPMGPGIPGESEGDTDRSRTVADYITPALADATRDYVEAQEADLREPSPETRSAYEAARDRLVAARLDHRQNRGNGFTIGAAARRGA